MGGAARARLSDSVGRPGCTEQSRRDKPEGSGSTLNTSGARTTNLYDHVLIFSQAATQELIGSPEVLDVLALRRAPRCSVRRQADPFSSGYPGRCPLTPGLMP